MQFPERFSGLPEYAFPRLRKLLAGHAPGGPEIAMSIGEPRHAQPEMVARVIAGRAGDFSRYPPNEGAPELRGSIADWIGRRFGAQVDPETGVMVLNGTREGLFNASLALSPERKGAGRPVVLVPNPFYQAYGAGALAAGAEVMPVAVAAGTGFLPDYAGLPAALLDRVSLCFICSPSNPQGAVAGEAYLRALLALAERHDFRVLSDECYSEIYPEAPPIGLLSVARDLDADPERAMVFNSLSKRSSVPGLRVGFAAGGAASIAAMRQLRAYGGAPVPLPLQHAAAALWGDEGHVEASRSLYREKFAVAAEVLGAMPGYAAPQGGFFLWLRVGDGEAATLRLWREAGVRVLPGGYLGRADAGGVNPGDEFIRVALVADPAEVARGLTAIRDVLGNSKRTERVG